MKKTIIISLITSNIMMAGMIFTNPLPNSNKAKENGGTLDAIDAYKDGVGAMMVHEGRGIDNSAMNTLVFKYGSTAKTNTLTIPEQVTLTGTATDKLLAGVFYQDGVLCNDDNALTYGDKYTNGICHGVIPTCPADTSDTHYVYNNDGTCKSLKCGIIDNYLCTGWTCTGTIGNTGEFFVKPGTTFDVNAHPGFRTTFDNNCVITSYYGNTSVCNAGFATLTPSTINIGSQVSRYPSCSPQLILKNISIIGTVPAIY